MLSCAINERHGNPWASEQAYFSARNVYRFLGAEENLAIRLRHGRHSISARDMEDYIDFFDYVFGRGGDKPEPRLFYDYSFDKWRQWSGEQIEPQNYPEKNLDDLLTDANGNRIASPLPVAGRKKEGRYQAERLRWALRRRARRRDQPGTGKPSKQCQGRDCFRLCYLAARGNAEDACHAGLTVQRLRRNVIRLSLLPGR